MKMWAEHSVDGYYISTSEEQYWSHKVWVTKTKAERISERVFFKHKFITQPTLTSEDMIIKVLQDLKHASKRTSNHNGNENLEALVKMNELFNTEPK